LPAFVVFLVEDHLYIAAQVTSSLCTLSLSTDTHPFNQFLLLRALRAFAFHFKLVFRAEVAFLVLVFEGQIGRTVFMTGPIVPLFAFRAFVTPFIPKVLALGTEVAVASPIEEPLRTSMTSIVIAILFFPAVMTFTVVLEHSFRTEVASSVVDVLFFRAGPAFSV
jgi:hypothetical protein